MIMTMLKCKSCGELLGNNEPILDSVSWDDRYESSWEISCPHCGGEVEEAFLCKYCDEFHTHMVEDDICVHCVDKYATVENFMKYTEHENIKEEVDIDRAALEVLCTVGIDLNDVAVKIAKDLIEDPRYKVRLKNMAVHKIVNEFIITDFIDKVMKVEVLA